MKKTVVLNEKKIQNLKKTAKKNVYFYFIQIQAIDTDYSILDAQNLKSILRFFRTPGAPSALPAARSLRQAEPNAMQFFLEIFF